MSALVVSPLSNASTPNDVMLSASLFDSSSAMLSGKKTIVLPLEIAELRSTIITFENTNDGQTTPSELSDDSSVNSFISSVFLLPTGASCSSTGVARAKDIGFLLGKTNTELAQLPTSSRRVSRRHRLRKQFSTTSTVLARNTITNPNFSQVNYCIAAILQAQIFDDLLNPNISTCAPPEFRLETGLLPEEGGVVHQIAPEVLEFETRNDEDLRDRILRFEVPTIDTIYRYIVTIIDRAHYSLECNILALIYINRMTQRKNFALMMDNWRGFWISAVILAQKVWDDRPVRTSSFADMIPNTTKDQMRVLELSAFRLLDFGTRVKPSTYAKYYFELRRLYGEIVGAEGFETWNVSPLTVAEGRRLEYRSSLPGMQYQSSHNANISRNKNRQSQSVVTTTLATKSTGTISRTTLSISSSAATFSEEYFHKQQSQKRVLQQSSVQQHDHQHQVPTTDITSNPIKSPALSAYASTNTVSNQPDFQVSSCASSYSTTSSCSSTSSKTSSSSTLIGNKRRVRGHSKTTEDLQPLSSSARYIIS